MSIKIGHAVSDENGKTSGGQKGDQNGREIRIQNWYISKTGNWDYLLVCTDKALARRAADLMKKICESPNFGYSQRDRWTGYRAIARGLKDAKGDFDCSSLCLSCYILSGLNIPPEGYTGNMRQILVNTGKFKSYKGSKYVTSDAYARVGALYLRENFHVCMALEDGSKAKEEDEAPEVRYFQKYVGTSISIVDALISIDENITFTYRKNIALANGIPNYKGTALQNLKLLALLKKGKLIRP